MKLHNAHTADFDRRRNIVDWWDVTLEASHWAALSNVDPTRAAMLLCQFNPNAETFDDAKLTTSDELKPEHLIRTEQRLADIDKADPRPRTLRDWHQTAKDLGLKYHSWIDGYMEAIAAPTPLEQVPMVTGGDGPAKPHSNKSEKTLIFEAKVLELLCKFWNDRTPGTEPTKGELCKLVYDEILRTPVRGARKTTRGMVNDVAKLWKMPIVLPALVPDSKFNDKRHPFKGDK